MNKLLTFEGGQPFTIEDLNFIQGNFIKSVESIVKALAGNIDCVLTGMMGDSWNIESVYIGGNVYILANPITESGGKKYLCIKQTEDGQRLFRDSINHNVYLVDDAYMSDFESDICLNMNAAKTLSDILVNGYGLWKEFFTISESAEIAVPNTDSGLAKKDSILVNVNKTTTDSNVLWRGGFRDPEVYEGMVVYNKKIYIVSGSLISGFIYNIDGTEYTGAISFNNLELKRRM